jgi:hypothetical protein
LGIDSDAPGFKKIKIVPHLSSLTNASGSIPHPDGNISVSYKKINNEWKILITLPGNTSGQLLWKGKEYSLKQGKNSFTVK